jgi:hypothetical protein
MDTSFSSVLPQPSLGLQPEDYFRATWREHIPLECPEAQPFELETAIAKLRKAKRKSKYWNWELAEIPYRMTPVEAEFWLRAIGFGYGATSLKSMLLYLKTLTFTGNPDEIMPCESVLDSPAIVLPLYCLLPKSEILENLMMSNDSGYYSSAIHRERPILIQGFRHYILPYLTVQELHQLRQLFQVKVQQNRCHPSGEIAIALGWHDDLLKSVESFSPGDYSWKSHTNQVLGLGSVDLVKDHIQRLKLNLANADQVQSWLAHTEYSGLEKVHDDIQRIRNKKETKYAIEMMAVFSQVKCLEMGKHMLSLSLDSQVADIARTWIKGNPEWAIAGFLPLATGRSKLANPALDWLQRFQLEGHGDLILKTAEAIGLTTADNIQSVLQFRPQRPERSVSELPEYWRSLCEALNQQATTTYKPLPKYVNFLALPKIETEEFSLPPSLIESVLNCITSDLTDIPVFIGEIKNWVISESLDRFIWALFQQQQDENNEIDHLVGNVMGLLGGDWLVSQLIDYHKRHFSDRDIIHVLSIIGTDYALQCLQPFKYSLKGAGVNQLVEQAFQDVATKRQISVESLEDRIVPTLGLDAQGRCRFDFGDRYFTASIDSQLQITLQDQAGKLRSTLPKPTQKDDPEKARTTIETWQTWKPRVLKEIKLQTIRLERWMAAGHTWAWLDFQTDILPHPLMAAIARTLLWTGIQGAQSIVFQIAEDHSLVGVDGQEIDPQGFETVCITHPGMLSRDSKNAWGEVLSDYQMIQPFPQMSRRTDFEPIEPDPENIFTYPEAHQIFSIALIDRLAKLGWRECSGWPTRNWRTFYLRLFGIVAVISCDEIPRTYNYRLIHQIMFIPEMQLERSINSHYLRLSKDLSALPCASIPQSAFSEVFYQLRLLTAK